MLFLDAVMQPTKTSLLSLDSCFYIAINPSMTSPGSSFLSVTLVPADGKYSVYSMDIARRMGVNS